MSITGLAILAVAAYLSSTIAGFLGMAGGISLVAVMAAVMPPAHVVPVHGVVMLASNITRTVVFVQHAQWRIFWIYALPSVFGTVGATLVWSGEKLVWFQPGIGIFLLGFLAWQHYAPKLRNIPLWVYAPLGAMAGFIAIFVGAMGPFIAPFFLRDDFKKEQVIATKALCQALGHLLKIPAFWALQFQYSQHLDFIMFLIVCVVLGTFSGKWILNRMSNRHFVFAYEGVLALLAVYLISKGWQ